MSVLFVLVIIAAVVGIVRPYLPRWNRGHFFGIALLSFFLIGVFAPRSVKNADAHNDAAQSKEAAISDPQATNGATSISPEQSKWSYSEDRDQMRGDLARYASVISENQVDLDFPYGEVNGTITIRKRPSDGLNIMFSVDKGQILCNSFENSHISAKFDDGSVRKYRCTGTSDGSWETAFIQDEHAFLSELRRSKRAIIEAEFYQKGNQQFTFQTADLKWN